MAPSAKLYVIYVHEIRLCLGMLWAIGKSTFNTYIEVQEMVLWRKANFSREKWRCLICLKVSIFSKFDDTLTSLHFSQKDNWITRVFFEFLRSFPENKNDREPDFVVILNRTKPQGLCVLNGKSGKDKGTEQRRNTLFEKTMPFARRRQNTRSSAKSPFCDASGLESCVKFYQLQHYILIFHEYFAIKNTIFTNKQ